MKTQLLLHLSLGTLLAYTPYSQAGFLTAIGKGISKLWDEATGSSTKHIPDTSYVPPKPEIQKKTFDEVIGNSADSYRIEPVTRNSFEVNWLPQARLDFLRVLDKQCVKSEMREKIESSVEEYRQFIDKAKTKRDNISTYVGSKILIYVLNKKVIPSTGISFISVEFDNELDLKNINFELASMCGYSTKYEAISGNITISGARVDGTQVISSP